MAASALSSESISERFEDRLPIDVFVVSPNARLRQDLQARLTLPRWQVFEAGSGAGALDLLRRRGGDDGILLLDPMLPDLEPNGFNAIVRERHPNTQVLMLNSHTGQLLIGTTSPTRSLDHAGRRAEQGRRCSQHRHACGNAGDRATCERRQSSSAQHDRRIRNRCSGRSRLRGWWRRAIPPCW